MRDSEVVASIVAGDPEGLATAYDRYADPLYKYCRTLLRDPADAADAIQDTFVIAASRVSGLRDPDRLRAWLYAVARNESLRVLRVSREASALDEAPDVSDDAADDREAAELRALLDGAAGGLGLGEREVIELQLRQGLELAEVASVLGVSRGHAATLVSRAHDQLEVCLAVLLVGRAGRDDCGELGAMLADWDGRLTVLLRQRLHRHIENCAACSAKRAIELRPAMLLGLAPAAALAAGAAASFQLAAGVPTGLKAHTIALATGQGADAVAHRAAVLALAGVFARDGFPRPIHGAAAAGLAAPHGAAGGVRRALRSSSQGQTAVAASVVLAVIIAAVAFALTTNGEGFTSAAHPKQSALVSASASASPAGPAKPTRTTPAPVATVALAATAAPPTPATPAAPSTAAVASATAVTPAAPTTAAASPSVSSPPAPAKPSTSPAPSPSPSPLPTGTLTLVPRGGGLIVSSGGRQILLYATGGNVDWSASVSNDPAGAIALSQSSGTLTAATATTTLTVTASQFVPCIARSYPTITINPGGTQYLVCTGFIKPFTSPGHRHRRRRADPAAPAAPTAPGLALSAPARQLDF